MEAAMRSDSLSSARESGERSGCVEESEAMRD